MKYRVVTNESFERYIDYLSRGRRRGRRFYEDRFDSLDLDDITADIDVPSEGEVNDDVRELDLFDDVAIQTGAQDVEVAADGKLRLLDLDPEGSPNKKSSEPDRDRRTAGLDLYDEPKKKDEPKSLPLGRRARHDAILKDLAKQQADAKSKEEPVRELDFDDKGKEVKQKKSNVGAIGALDYDADIDTSKIAASIEDVYTALASSDSRIVKAMVKRYAADITDENKIKEIQLAHAIKLNYESLRVMCGDMRVAITDKEKKLGFIDRDEIKKALQRFESIADKLTGENNTYGLIPNAIVSCSQENQLQCKNVIDFLVTWLELPVMPIYFRGAAVRHLYDVASFLLSKMPDVQFSTEFLTGKKGLLTRIKNYNDIPKSFIDLVAEKIANSGLNFEVVADFIMMCFSSGGTKATYNASIKKMCSKFTSYKIKMILGYLATNDKSAQKRLAKLLKIELDDED